MNDEWKGVCDEIKIRVEQIQEMQIGMYFPKYWKI
jgi:hypothetical protein